MKIAITGKGSFIGKNIIDSISSLEFVEFDLQNNPINELNFEGLNTTIHLAAIVHQKTSIPESTYFKVNSDLAFNTAKHAKNQGVKHFVFFSTIKVYGDGGYKDVVFNEMSECFPVDSYGKSKLDAENRLLALADENFKVSVIRPSMVYGKGVKANMLSLSKLVKKLPIIPFGNIQNKRSMVSIDNLMITLQAVIEKQETGIFLACDKKPVSTTEIVENLIQIINPKKKLISFPSIFQSIFKVLFPHQMRRIIGSFNVDASETHKNLGIEDKLVNMEVGLRKMFE